MGYSPGPTYTMLGFDALTPNAPIVPPKYLSVTGSQVSPPSVVLKTPPPVVPIQNSLGREAEPATATERPPRKIPVSRHLKPANTGEAQGAGWAVALRGAPPSRGQRSAPPSGDGRGDTGRGSTNRA